MTDLYLNNIGNKYFDIVIASNGDFDLTDGLDTSIKLSIYEERRDISIKEASRRGGWWGNQLRIDNYELGSLLWTKSQNSIQESDLSAINGILTDCLQWLIDDKISDNIQIDLTLDDNIVNSNITIFKNENIIDTFYTQLFNETRK